MLRKLNYIEVSIIIIIIICIYLSAYHQSNLYLSADNYRTQSNVFISSQFSKLYLSKINLIMVFYHCRCLINQIIYKSQSNAAVSISSIVGVLILYSRYSLLALYYLCIYIFYCEKDNFM